MSIVTAALTALTLLTAAPAPASAPTPTPVEVVDEQAEQARSIADFEASLHYQRGEIVLPNGKAALRVPAGFRFLAADEARRVLEQLWGNPPDASVLGMLFPADVSPADPEAGWGVVVEYTEEGHIDDADAAEIDYDELLKSMQVAVVDENRTRREQGYPEVQIGGWAEAPRYDASTHKLYWAKQLTFGDHPEPTLNYAIRVLGREGVLELNAVAPMQRLATIKPAMEQVLGFVEFTPGNRYSDFDPERDRSAAYGIGGLIAGAMVASKTGILKGLWLALLAGKKFMVIGMLALGAFITKLFGRDKQDS